MKRVLVRTSIAAAAAALAVTGFGGIAIAGGHAHDNNNGGDGGNTHVACSFHGPVTFSEKGHHADQALSNCSAVGASDGGNSF